MLADEICRRLAGAHYFQWLLTRFTTPEELFGAVSLKALEQDDYRRLTTHKLPEAHIAFLDEVFKASSSILNTILTLINERRFHNGREVADVPLLTLFAASNELPEDDELLALHDRFLLRFVVDYVSEDFRFLKLLQARPATSRTTLSLADLRAARVEAEALPVPASVLRAIADIRRELGRKSIVASDRRWAQAVGLLRAHAYLAGRATASEQDLPFLEHVLWRDPAERSQARDTIREPLTGYADEVQVLLFHSRGLRAYALREWARGAPATGPSPMSTRSSRTSSASSSSSNRAGDGQSTCRARASSTGRCSRRSATIRCSSTCARRRSSTRSGPGSARC